MLNRRYLLAFTLLTLWSTDSHAQAVGKQGAIDPARIRPEKDVQKSLAPSKVEIGTENIKSSTIDAPEQAKQVKFILKKVEITGITSFKNAEIKELYAKDIGKNVSAEVIWKIAQRITEKYRNAGYFLSRAYVPAQSIKDGIIKINVVEGYIAEVDFDNEVSSVRAVKHGIKRLKSEKPIKSSSVESFLLRLNDMPGVSIKGVLSPASDENEAAAKLTLVPVKAKSKGVIAFNNYGSRFLGPNQGVVSYSFDTLPLQQTTLSLSSTLPADEVKYAALNHKGQITADIGFNVDASLTKAEPGFSLKPFEIESTSTFVGVGFDYKALRQRDKSLTYDISFDARKTKTDLINSEIVNDEIRALRLGADYIVSDSLYGTSFVDVKLSQGLDVLGASNKNDLNLSRADSEPNFTKLETELSRVQQIGDNWLTRVSVLGQVASGSLFSSEEFGYGGAQYGRAYDASEFTGDSGVSGAIELSYNKYLAFEPVGFAPYAFYDMGKVWNRNSGQPSNITAASVGFGTRIFLPKDVTANISLAFPLTRDVENPIYGADEQGPRILVQILNEF